MELDHRPHEAMRDAMHKAGVSGVDLAERIGVSTTYIYQMREGKRAIPPDAAISIAEVLDTDFEPLSPQLSDLVNRAIRLREKQCSQ